MKQFWILIYFLSLFSLQHGSFKTEAAAYNAVPYLGTGYDIRVANPEGNSRDYNFRDSDPGLKPTRFIVTRTVSDINDEVLDCPPIVSKSLNSFLAKEYLTDDLIKYHRQIQDRWNGLDEDDNYVTTSENDVTFQQKPILKIGGGSSIALQEAKRILMVKKNVMVTKETSKIYTEARLNKFCYRYLTKEFRDTICNLPKNNMSDEYIREYNNFFKTWGTHVIVEVSLGQKDLVRRIYDKGASFEAFRKTRLINEKSGKISSDYNPKFNLEILETLNKVSCPEGGCTYAAAFSQGTEENPVPIRMHLQPISDFVIYATSCYSNSKVLKERMEEAVKEYISSGFEEPEVVVRDYSRFFHWPRGTFSLLKPKRGCPAKDWSHGYRFHDTEDRKPSKNEFHEDWNKLLSGFNRPSSIQFEFCTTNNESSGSRTLEWERGSYCIFRQGGACPSEHFSNAEILINDEDSENQNGKGGILPDGDYVFTDTKYRLCCRDDSIDADEYNTPLSLPNKFPFVLLPVGETCQPVYGMNAKMMWTVVDGEEKNPMSKCTGSPVGPMCEIGVFNILKIYFCYYEPINRK